MRILLSLILALGLTACDEATNPAQDGAPPPDAGLDQAMAEASVADQGPLDMAAPDLAAPDVTPPDLAPPDAAAVEGGASDMAPLDAGTPDLYLSDFTPPKAVLQAVVKKIFLPTSTTKSQKYAFDLDGNGTKDNGLGSILAMVGALGGTVDLESMVNMDILAGKLLYMMEVLGSSAQNSNPAWVQIHLGEDSDSNPLNNFSGTAKLKVASGSPKGSFLKGKLVSQALTVGPDQVVAPLPLSAGSSVLTTSKLTRLSGTLGATYVNSGILGGAIPMTEIYSKVVPAMAAIINRIYTDPLTDASTKSLLKSLFDTNSDGTITGKELAGNILVITMLVPDIDTDGDKVKDALSIGFGFEAVSCQIQ